MTFDEAEPRIEQAHASLVAAGIVEPLSEDQSETRSWLDHELASFVENRLGIEADPRAIEPGAREDFIRRATDEGRLYGPHGRYATPYWLVDGRERAGTITLSSTTLGARMAHVGSLYVAPQYRRRGLARRALVAARDAVSSVGLSGIVLDASWCWQPALRFYSCVGMWVRGWKRDLRLAFCDDLPAWSIEVDGENARFIVQGATLAESGVAFTVRREGERLHWEETRLGRRSDEGSREWQFLAPGTFALALALRGWPLITDDCEWHEQLRRGWSDMGGPEGLAFKIRIWEAWVRQRGFRVDTPTIPGIDYPSWQSLEEGWAARSGSELGP